MGLGLTGKLGHAWVGAWLGAWVGAWVDAWWVFCYLDVGGGEDW